jgi:hypothetical protein
MSPLFGPIQLLFYYPFFFLFLYIYLVFLISIKNTFNISNIFYFFLDFIKNKLNLNK